MKKDVALALLGLSEDGLTEERINEAYRAAIQLNHPDRYATNEQLRRHAEEQCKFINQARDVLLSGNWERESEASRSGYSQPEPEPYGRQEHRAYEAPHNTDGIPSEAPMLDLWKTSVGYSVLGIVVFAVLSYLIRDIGSTSVMAAWIATLAQCACIVFQLVYATVIYPSLFSKKPKLKSSKAISFLNCAVGSFIFGPIWNGNLTKHAKGVAHIVFAVLVALLVAYWLFLFGYIAALA